MGKKVHSVIKPLKKEKKARRIKPNTNPPGPARFPIPTGHPKPFVKSPQHAKWPSMFKRHLGIIETHIRNLDRVMQSMRANMNEMGEAERVAWEKGEKGMWKIISDMMTRAKATLIDARIAAQGILPSRALKEKKSLGTYGSGWAANTDKMGNKFMPHEGSSSSGSDSNSNSDTDSEEDWEDSDNEKSAEPVVTSEAKYTPLNMGKKRKLEIPAPAPGEKDESGDTVMSDGGDEEANPYFIIDTEPTPVHLNAEPAKKKPRKEARAEVNRLRKEASKAKKDAKYAAKQQEAQLKKRSSDDDLEPEAKPKVEDVDVEVKVHVHKEPAQEEFDFKDVEKELMAEVEAGMKAAAKKAEKKRKRISDGTSSDVVEKKHKKEKKRKPEDGESGSDGEKKQKKRKVEGEAVDGEKKKRKHKAEEA